nr:sigma-70 family RNA polymerase sigma factor [Kofleriaceae bacterium]
MTVAFAFALPSPLLAIQAARGGDRATAPALQVPAATIDACRRGERAALEEVFRTYAPALERLVVRLVGPGADAQDLLQDTFAAAIEAFPRFRGEASVRSWLHRIAVHVAHHELRRPRRREIAIDDGDALAPAGGRADAQLAGAREAERLYAHLGKLDARKRIALVLYVIEGCSVAEIAALMGASQTATKSRLFWARRALLASLRRDPAFAGRGDQP